MRLEQVHRCTLAGLQHTEVRTAHLVQKGPMGQMMPFPAAAMGAYGIYGAAMMRPLLPMVPGRGFGEAFRGRGRGPPSRGRGRGRW